MTTTNNSNHSAALEGDVKQRAELASQPDLSETLQSELLQDKAEPVLVALASNPALLEEVQEKLAISGSPAVREALAANPSLDEKQQNYLVLTGSNEVKFQLAKNPSLIVAIQSIFSVDITPGIREALAENPSLDKLCQPKLMEDNDEYRQQIVYTLMPLASNPALAAELYARLAEHEDNRVVASLAQNPSIPEALMKRFAASDYDEVRAGLACNPSLPESLQARLIAGNSNNVRVSLAGNSALKIAQQAQLAHVGNVDVRLALLDNPSLNEQIQSRVVASFNKCDLSSAESDLDYAEKKASRLNTECSDAGKKYDRSMGVSMSFLSSFMSDEKLEQLYKKYQRAQKAESEAWRETEALEEKCSKIRTLLKRQPNTSSDDHGFSFGGLVFG